jgi:hypothetical protein
MGDNKCIWVFHKFSNFLVDETVVNFKDLGVLLFFFGFLGPPVLKFN